MPATFSPFFRAATATEANAFGTPPYDYQCRLEGADQLEGSPPCEPFPCTPQLSPMIPSAEIILGPTEIAQRIVVLRGQRVLLDADLARIYGVSTSRLNEQVKRNARRFPEDFVFQLTREEARKISRLRSQNATLKKGQHIKHLPHAFTEHGAGHDEQLAAVIEALRQLTASPEPAHNRKMGFPRGNR